MRGYGPALGESLPPLIDAMPEGNEIETVMVRGIGSQISPATFQQRPAAHGISLGIMMQGDGDLNQPLKKLALRLRSSPPDILQDFVGFKEMGGVEQAQSLKKEVTDMLLVDSRDRNFAHWTEL
jgi:hypothetical protein